jgi:DNA-binding response OmpR family regulator
VQDLAAEADRMGADDHLAKPFLVQDLLNKLLRLLDLGRQANALRGA